MIRRPSGDARAEVENAAAEIVEENRSDRRGKVTIRELIDGGRLR